jgi:hypothetical protein
MAIKQAAERVWPAAIAVAMSVLLGFLIATGEIISPAIAIAIFGLALGCVVMFTGRYCLASLRQDGSPRLLGSLLLGLVMIATVLLPAVLRYAGLSNSTLERFGVVLTKPVDELRWAVLVSLLALVGFVAGELFGTQVRRGGALARRSIPQDYRSRIYWVLLTLWAIKLVLFGSNTTAEAIVTRGAHSGEGISVALLWALPLAISYAIIEKHFGNRWLVALNLLLIGVAIVPSAVRSPLLLIACACLIRVLLYVARSQTHLRTLIYIILVGYILASLFSALSVYRGELRQGRHVSIGSAFVGQLQNAAISEKVAGLDTLDGLLLSRKVQRSVIGANYFDPTKAVLGFVPTQIWPNKPGWLSVKIAHDYLDWKVGGIFYSGQGWARIVFNGLLGMLAWFVGLGIAVGLAFRRQHARSMATVLWAYFIIRFTASGDSFNMFHTLMLATVFYTVVGLTSIFGRSGLHVRIGQGEAQTMRAVHEGRPVAGRR